MPNKKIYIIELAKSKYKIKEEKDLISIIEELKKGIIESIFENEELLLMEPPHILISSNYPLNEKLLNKDKWEIFEITKDKTLVEKNALLSN